jgi:hypothetical protein
MQVDFKAGYSGCDYPKAVFWQGNNLTVQYINKEWREPSTKHYLITTDNGYHFKLVFFEASGSWSIHEVSSSLNP